MTRKEEISKAAEKELKDCTYINTSLIGFDFFIKGAEWADAHPHWRSVKDEMPPIGGIVLVAIPLGGELSVLPLSIKNESDFKCLSGMTHWMPTPQLPKKGD